MQPYGNRKLKHNYRNHSYKTLHGCKNWWEDMCCSGKKKARQESKKIILKQLRETNYG
jgi:hypothetical protein